MQGDGGTDGAIDGAAPCVMDDDCGPGFACACNLTCDFRRSGQGSHSCIEAECRSDGDCGPGGFCSLSVVPGAGNCTGLGFFSTGYFCHTPADECTNDSDCAGNDTHHRNCLFSVDKWRCGGGP